MPRFLRAGKARFLGAMPALLVSVGRVLLIWQGTKHVADERLSAKSAAAGKNKILDDYILENRIHTLLQED